MLQFRITGVLKAKRKVNLDVSIYELITKIIHGRSCPASNLAKEPPQQHTAKAFIYKPVKIIQQTKHLRTPK
jgi:hypothetical protein